VATSQPVTILILGMERAPELDALSEQGHTIIYANSLKCEGAELVIDQVMGPRCWRLLADQMKWVPLAVKEMRALQPKAKRKKKGTDGTPAS